MGNLLNSATLATKNVEKLLFPEAPPLFEIDWWHFHHFVEINRNAYRQPSRLSSYSQAIRDNYANVIQTLLPTQIPAVSISTPTEPF